MDGDTLAIFTHLLNKLDEPADLRQLQAMRQQIESHMLMLEGLRLNVWRKQGYRPAPSGLACPDCGSATWHKTSYSPGTGEVEKIKCVSLECGTLREVRI